MKEMQFLKAGNCGPLAQNLSQPLSAPILPEQNKAHPRPVAEGCVGRKVGVIRGGLRNPSLTCWRLMKYRLRSASRSMMPPLSCCLWYSLLRSACWRRLSASGWYSSWGKGAEGHGRQNKTEGRPETFALPGLPQEMGSRFLVLSLRTGLLNKAVCTEWGPWLCREGPGSLGPIPDILFEADKMPLLLAEIKRVSLPWAVGVRGLLSVRRDRTRAALYTLGTAHPRPSEKRGEITGLLPSPGHLSAAQPYPPASPTESWDRMAQPHLMVVRWARAEAAYWRSGNLLKPRAILLHAHKDALVPGQRGAFINLQDTQDPEKAEKAWQWKDRKG